MVNDLDWYEKNLKVNLKSWKDAEHKDIEDKTFEATKPKKGRSTKKYRYDKLIEETIGWA